MKSERIKSLNWTSSSNFCREALLVLPAFIISKCLVFLAWILSKLLSGTFDPPNGERFDRGLMAWDGDWYASIVVNGYDGVVREGIRFFPGYVVLGRFLDALIPGPVSVSLILIANIASLTALLAIKNWFFLKHVTSNWQSVLLGYSLFFRLLLFLLGLTQRAFF